MKENYEEKILVMFPSSKNFPVAQDPLKDLLEEFSHIRDEEVLSYLSKEELEYDLKELNHKMSLIEQERMKIQYYINEIEQNLNS